MNLSGARIIVIGFGVEHQALLPWLVERQARVTVLERLPKAHFGRIVDDWKKKGVVFRLGENHLDYLRPADHIVRTPGLQRWHPALRPYQKILTSALELFFEFAPTRKIVGITGTKGKGTTATLLSLILKKSGLKAHLAGNIGLSPFSIIEIIKPRDWVILELSSFQLEDLTFSPHVAVVLDVTADHLAPLSRSHPNYHRSRAAYLRSKERVLAFQKKDDLAIIYADSPAPRAMAKKTAGQRYWFSTTRQLKEGAFINAEGFLVVATKEKKWSLLPVGEVMLVGRHNLQNALAAALCAALCGAKKEAIVTVLKTFKGLEHRLQKVATLKGVQFWDDSVATTPEAAIAALKAFNKPVLLVAGGADKGSDLGGLAKTIVKRRAKAVALLGQTAPVLEKAITRAAKNSSPTKIFRVYGMEEAMQKFSVLTQSGDVILLSPGCASTDQFIDYAERAAQFLRAARKIYGA